MIRMAILMRTVKVVFGSIKISLSRRPPFTPAQVNLLFQKMKHVHWLDNLYQLSNIYAVVSFSSNNNLSAPYTFNSANTTPGSLRVGLNLM